jgi:hypothetical protein
MVQPFNQHKLTVAWHFMVAATGRSRYGIVTAVQVFAG